MQGLPDTFPSREEWSLEHQQGAHAEGWDLWDCDGSENGRTQLCAFDDKEEFPQAKALPEDGDAWAHVVAKARSGSDLHLHALKVVAAHNPIEAASIEKHTGYSIPTIEQPAPGL